MTGIRRDYYEVLGVPRTASARQIRDAFRTLARQYHPDVSTQDDAASRFQELSTAYEVLHDPAERARYDLAAIRVRPRRVPRQPQRPMFVSPRQDQDVPHFLGAKIGWDPLVIRVAAVFRWLR